MDRGVGRILDDDDPPSLSISDVGVQEGNSGTINAVFNVTLSAASSKEEIAQLLKDAADLCCELNTRWLETTQHITAAQNRLLSLCAEAAAKVQSGREG